MKTRRVICKDYLIIVLTTWITGFIRSTYNVMG